MNLKPVTIHTRVARAGMTVRQVFEECIRANTPGLPFCDDHGLVSGRVTLKYILKRHYLPEYLVDMARVLGDQVVDAEDMGMLAKHLFDDRIDSYIQDSHTSLSSACSVIKALALMEKLDTGYLFVIDEKQYMGVVTLHNLSETILAYDNSSASIRG